MRDAIRYYLSRAAMPAACGIVAGLSVCILSSLMHFPGF